MKAVTKRKKAVSVGPGIADRGPGRTTVSSTYSNHAGGLGYHGRSDQCLRGSRCSQSIFRG